MKKILISLLLLGFILCGCTQKSVAVSEPTVATTEIQTEPHTEPTTEPTTKPTTEPDLSISVEAGEHSSIFTDVETGDYMEYILDVPENAVKDMPLVVYLHGDGSVGRLDAVRSNAFIARTKQIYGEEYPYIILSPCTRITSWINGSIPQTLKNLIDMIATQCEVDTDRVIITGFSRGSIGVWHMISTYGDYFSAAVAVSCGNDSQLNVENCCKVPLRCFAGNGNQTEALYYYAMERNVQIITEAGGDAQITKLEGKIHGETQAEAYCLETFEWMLAQ